MAAVLETIGADLPELIRQLDEWSSLVVSAGAAPPDPFKRVSG